MFECREKAIENLVAENNELREHIKCLQSELEEIQRVKFDLPVKPIEVAAMLIRSTVTCKQIHFKRHLMRGARMNTRQTGIQKRTYARLRSICWCIAIIRRPSRYGRRI